MLVAIIAVVVLAVVFFWPERARADVSVSARIGAGFGGHHVGSRLHHGGGLHGRFRFGGDGFHGGVHFGGRDFKRHRSFGHHHGHRKHGLLLGDRFRLDTHRRAGGGKHASGFLLGDRFRFEQQRRLDREFLRRDGRRGDRFHDRGFHRDRVFGHELYGHEADGRKWRRHGRGRHYGKWLRPEPLLLPYGGADVIVREVIVPVPVPADRQPESAPERQSALDPRGRVTLVGEADGVVGDWAPGDVLPEGVPHVTLDPAAYGLPEPPSGEKYARVGNDVLRIDVGSRRIAEVVAR